MNSPSPKRTRRLIRLGYGIISSLNREVEIETKRVPVSEDPYIQVSFGFTTDEAERKRHGEDLIALRKQFIESLKARGMAGTPDYMVGPLYKNHYMIEEDQFWVGFWVCEVDPTFYQPYFHINPSVAKVLALT